MRRCRVCPVSLAGTLDSGLRRLLQNPRRVLEPYVKEGMKVLDFGCGPGFFTMEIAKRVGESGSVIASDLQDGMLDILEEKIKGTDIESRITLHKSSERSVGVPHKIDLVFAFYVMHELEESSAFLREFESALTPKGMLYIAEPKAHVSKRDFRTTMRHAEESGFTLVGNSARLMTREAVFEVAAAE